MSSLNQVSARWLQVVVVLGSAFAFYSLAPTASRNDMASLMTLIPKVVGVYAIVQFVFVRWGWSWRVFKGWLVTVPDLRGTWIGELSSSFPNDSGTPTTVQAKLIIRQSLNKVTCVMFSTESESVCTVAAITRDNDDHTYRLNFIYANRSNAVLRNRSPLHDGSAALKIIKTPRLKLAGEYWTNRQTTGHLEVELRDRKYDEEF